MNKPTNEAVVQLSRLLQRAQALRNNNEDRDYIAYDITKTALLAIASYLSPDLALLVMQVIGEIDNKYARTLGEEQ